MANTSSNNRKTTKKSSTKSKNNKKNDKNDSIVDEIIILLLLAISILMLISNFGFGGKVGAVISSVTFGIWGWIGYVIPICLFFGATIFYLNRTNKKMYVKLIAGMVLVISICTLSEMILVSFDADATIISYYQHSSEFKTGGGIVGGIFAKFMLPAIGRVGSIVVESILIIICLVIISEKSFLKIVTSISGKAHTDMSNATKRANAERKERREIRAEEKARAKKLEAEELKQARQLQQAKPRKYKKVSGVSFDTTLASENKVSEEKITPPSDMFLTPLTPEEQLDLSDFPNKTNVLSEHKNIDVEEPIVIPETKTRKPRKTKASKQELEEQTNDISKDIQLDTHSRNDSNGSYVFPSIELLSKGKSSSSRGDSELQETALKLQQTLHSFGVKVQVTDYSRGPSVTRYELQPEKGVKVSRIVGLADDIKLNLAAADIRIEAPIPGKAAVGIEVPNKENSTVALRSLLESPEFIKHESNIAFAAGKDIGGKTIVTDIGKMPHVLIAGSTGSGKSVCINTLIMSILFKANPEDVKLIMIDPKVVELSVYNGIPHLLIPVVTDPKKAAGALHWAVAEMTKRYQLFAEYNVRDLKGFNEKVKNIEDIEDENKPEKMPQIVVIVDELADLMMVAPGDVEDAICRLAQLARAAGIHLILATQRPSVNVITGLIKANMPSRIAFAVSSGVDSRTIIDMNGAEKLLGKGDMLFYPAGYPKPARVQGAFVSDQEVQKVVEFLVEQQGEVTYNKEVEEHVTSSASGVGNSGNVAGSSSDGVDSYFVEAGKFIIEKDKASIGMLQRMFKIGFNRAARIMDQLCEAGVVGEEEGTKPRKVLMSMEEFEQYIDEYI